MTTGEVFAEIEDPSCFSGTPGCWAFNQSALDWAWQDVFLAEGKGECAPHSFGWSW